MWCVGQRPDGNEIRPALKSAPQPPAERVKRTGHCRFHLCSHEQGRVSRRAVPSAVAASQPTRPIEEIPDMWSFAARSTGFNVGHET